MGLKNIVKRFGELILGLAVIGGSLWVYYYWVNDSNAAVKAKGRGASVPLVIADTLKVETVPVWLEAQGCALANESVDLSVSVQEKVKEIHFDDGKTVKKGDLLLVLESDTEDAELKQAEIDCAEAKRELERTESLFQSNIATQKEFDAQKTEFIRKGIEVKILRSDLEKRVLKAPFDGVLGVRNISLGDLVSPGTLITTLDDISTINVDFTVPEKYFAAMGPGMKFIATSSAYPQREFEGKVSFISPRLNDITRSVQVRGELVNPKDEKGNYLLRPGMLLSLQIQLESKNMIAVPEKSVQSLGEIQYIFILNDENVAATREIVPGIRRDGKVEILSGASANERFVLEGINKVRNGMKVRLLGAEEK